MLRAMTHVMRMPICLQWLQLDKWWSLQVKCQRFMLWKIWYLQNSRKLMKKALFIFTIWIFIPVRLRLVCSMTWQICLKRVFILSMDIFGKHRAFLLMPLLLQLFFRQTRMNSMADRQYPHLIFTWQKVC